MFKRVQQWLTARCIHWLIDEPEAQDTFLSDFDRLTYEIRPGDVILVEGRARVSHIIKTITLTPWTHAAIYIGRAYDISDPDTRAMVEQHSEHSPDTPLIVEAMLGEGSIISPLQRYKAHHIRLCRPRGLSPNDAQSVIKHAISKVGLPYDIRQILDLARFLFPWGLLPRRWRSSLFEHNAGDSTHTLCSSMIAEAFHTVRFPVIPVLSKNNATGEYTLYQRNFKLFTPRDFDISPYFDIIKYPMFSFDELSVYKKLPWDQYNIMLNDESEIVTDKNNSIGNQKKPRKEFNQLIKQLGKTLKKQQQEA